MMTIVFLAVYFGGVWVGMEPEFIAFVAVFVGGFSAVFAAIVTHNASADTSLDDSAPFYAAFVVVDSVAIAFFLADFGAVTNALLVGCPAFVLVCAAAGVAKGKMNVPYWKVLLVYLIQTVSIAVPIWLHLLSGG
jgi:hypothetical protein